MYFLKQIKKKIDIEKKIVEPQVFWGAEPETARHFSGQKREGQAMKFGLEIWDKTNPSKQHYTPEERAEILKLGEVEIIRRNVEGMEREKQAQKIKDDKERERRLYEINQRPMNKMLNFLSADLLGFLKKKK